MANFRRDLALLTASDMLIWFSFGIYYAYIAIFLLESGLSYYTIGLYLSTEYFGSFFGFILGGVYADRVGPKRAMVIGRILMPLVFFLISFLPLELTFIGIFIAGLSLSTSNTSREKYMVDLLLENRRGFYYNLMNSLSGVAFGLGAFSASKFIAHKGVMIGFKSACLNGGYLVSLAILFVLFVEERAEEGKISTIFGLREVFTRDTIFLAIIVTFVFLAISFTWTYISIYAIEVLKISEEKWGVILAAIYPLNATLSPIFGEVSDKLDLKKNYLVGCGLIMLFNALLAFPLSTGFTYLFLIFLVDIIGEGFFWPAYFRTEIQLTKKEHRGKIIGYVGLISFMTRGLFLPIIGRTYAYSKRLPYIISITLYILLIFGSLKLSTKEEKRD